MEGLVIEVTDENGSPRISLNRAIDTEDFANVDERANAIIFILDDDDKGWTFRKGTDKKEYATLKVRFRLAEDMKKKLDKYSVMSPIWSYAMNLWKVHRFEIYAKDATEEKEKELKEAVKKVIENSIQMINQY